MAGGFVVMARKIYENEEFAGEPFSRRDAFMWMVAAAAWKDTAALNRGQLQTSRRVMAATFGWTEDKVRWVLKRFKRQKMVEIHTQGHTQGHTQPPMVITICNYAGYQNAKPSRDQAHTQGRTPLEKKKKEREEKKENSKSFDYAFEGKFVRLNQRDFSVWQRGYSSVDLVALLTTRDIWLASDRATDADRKNWFISTSNWLANKNQEARKAALPQQRDPSTLWQQALL